MKPLGVPYMLQWFSVPCAHNFHCAPNVNQFRCGLCLPGMLFAVTGIACPKHSFRSGARPTTQRPRRVASENIMVLLLLSGNKIFNKVCGQIFPDTGVQKYKLHPTYSTCLSLEKDVARIYRRGGFWTPMLVRLPKVTAVRPD